MMDWSPRCYIHVPSVIVICPFAPEKKSFEGVLAYMGLAAILVIFVPESLT